MPCYKNSITLLHALSLVLNNYHSQAGQACQGRKTQHLLPQNLFFMP
ncbi:hypothetical protein HBZS_119240 [Helicobacter bizzozeronii CCUG 35545]|nr:hypothetical protein HBZS_119240 [Helicobacter bizzozeronii CCUG 35545]